MRPHSHLQMGLALLLGQVLGGSHDTFPYCRDVTRTEILTSHLNIIFALIPFFMVNQIETGSVMSVHSVFIKVLG